ncbi:hypothetical protein O3G_MSEX006293 [Manduca sexta]|uniref:Cytochrome P450 n=1 Tax=Manduca sexta TaxID=7130 RepID=A0A922CKT2_MANSE|nr:hypothetical protein O3G_MSEX006293 [Manduca sexta]
MQNSNSIKYNISETVFGVDELDDKNFIKQYMNATDTILKNFVDRFNNPLLYSDFMYQLLGYKKIEDEIIRISSNMSDTIINAKRAALKASKSTIYSMNSKGAKYKSLLELLLELSEKNMLTNKEIKDEVNTFIVAGYDTCSIVLTYTLMCLGTYPEVQERVHEEIQTVFGDTDRDVEKEDLSHLLYTEAVIKETLRLYPPGPFLLRYCDKVVQLKNYKMPADTQLILNMYGMNRDPVWGPDAEHFRPDRWLDLKLEQSNAFGSFSIGKRICPGQHFALISLKTMIAHVIRHYRIRANIHKLKFRVDVLAVPISDCKVVLERRNNSLSKHHRNDL